MRAKVCPQDPSLTTWERTRGLDWQRCWQRLMHIELLTILLIFINTELQLIKALAYMDPPPFPTIVLVFPLILINNPLSSLISIVQVVVRLNFSSQSFTFNTSYKASGSISARDRLRPQSFAPAIAYARNRFTFNTPPPPGHPGGDPSGTPQIRPRAWEVTR